MKKVVLIVPDEMIFALSGGRGRHITPMEITPGNLMKMLSRSVDYHEEYYIEKPEDITILSIENYKQTEGE
jgi:hypothetical protein